MRCHARRFRSASDCRADRSPFQPDSKYREYTPTRQLAVLRRIHHLVLRDSQFVIATHSPILMAYPRAKILMLEDNGFTEVRYEDTEHYAVTKQFINNPVQMIETMLAN